MQAYGGVYFQTQSDHNAGVYVASGSGSWASLSDRNAKENFQAADGEALLARLHAIPILTWNYKSQDDSIRHIGPLAQDFYAAFGVGEDDKHIATVDADGVALAAIQALYKLSLEKDKEIEQLKREMSELHARLEQLANR